MCVCVVIKKLRRFFEIAYLQYVYLFLSEKTNRQLLLASLEGVVAALKISNKLFSNVPLVKWYLFQIKMQTKNCEFLMNSLKYQMHTMLQWYYVL